MSSNVGRLYSARSNTLRAVVMCSTYERAIMAKNILIDFTKNGMQNICHATLTSGTSNRVALTQYRNGLDIALCTMGRTCGLLRKESNLLKKTEIFVFDDTIRLLSHERQHTQDQIACLSQLS